MGETHTSAGACLRGSASLRTLFRMGRLLSTWAVLVTALLWALPSGAEILELRRPVVPPLGVPERPAFEELLGSFADPDRALKGGFNTSLALAVRSRAWAFIPGSSIASIS